MRQQKSTMGVASLSVRSAAQASPAPGPLALLAHHCSSTVRHKRGPVDDFAQRNMYQLGGYPVSDLFLAPSGRHTAFIALGKRWSSPEPPILAKQGAVRAVLHTPLCAKMTSRELMRCISACEWAI